MNKKLAAATLKRSVRCGAAMVWYRVKFPRNIIQLCHHARTSHQRRHNKFVFRIPPHMGKTELKEILTTLYDLQVKKINTANYDGECGMCDRCGWAAARRGRGCVCGGVGGSAAQRVPNVGRITPCVCVCPPDAFSLLATLTADTPPPPSFFLSLSLSLSLSLYRPAEALGRACVQG